VGVGGGGKTRLAIEVARRLGPTFANGVAFADLSADIDDASATESVEASLGLPRGASGDLPHHLGDTQLLLVIDNAEHVLVGVSQLVHDLLTHCPNLKMLVTSREPLNIGAETCWFLAALRLPPPGVLHPDELIGYDSVDLFVVRAVETGMRFRLTTENAARVVAICRQLDGIPFALELAAARVISLGLDEIEGQLQEGIHLLSWGRRDALARHLTIESTIAWSYRLLNVSEQRLLNCLSIFVGPFNLNAVKAICMAGDRAISDIADLLQGLIQKSLLTPLPQPDGSIQYHMVGIVRHYAARTLSAPERQQQAALHAAHYCDVVGELSANAGTDSREYLQRIGAEYDDVLKALEWASAQRPDMEFELVNRLSRYWALSGLVHEGRQRLRAALVKPALPTEREASLRAEACGLALMADDLDDAMACAGRTMALLERIDDPNLSLLMLHHRACIEMRRGDLLHAERDLAQAIRLLESVPRSPLTAWVMNSLACLLLRENRHDEALAAARRAVDLITEAGDHPVALAQARYVLGSVYLEIGRVDDAYICFSDALICAVRYNLHHIAVEYLRGLAIASSKRGDVELCLELLGAASRCTRVAGDTGANGSKVFSLSTDDAEKRNRSSLGQERAEMAWSRGATMQLSDVMARISLRRRQQSRPAAYRGAGSDADYARVGELGSKVVQNHKLRRARYQNHWTQTDVARRIGTTKLTVSRWERGIQSPTLYFRSRICRLFEMNAHDLGLSIDADPVMHCVDLPDG
jgi:predicted ATPase/DNA-binding XRE family transcriptional regulator